MQRWLLVPGLVLALGAFSACDRNGDDDAVGAYEPVDRGAYEPMEEGAGVDRTGYTATADIGRLDNDIGSFLTEYYDDYEMFRDDNLTFDVREGVVTVTGALDSQAERSALVGWLNAVPGVQRVEDTNLGIGE